MEKTLNQSNFGLMRTMELPWPFMKICRSKERTFVRPFCALHFSWPLAKPTLCKRFKKYRFDEWEDFHADPGGHASVNVERAMGAEKRRKDLCCRVFHGKIQAPVFEEAGYKGYKTQTAPRRCTLDSRATKS